MYRTILLLLCLVLVPFGPAVAAGKKPAEKEPAAKELSGMSIVGNDEAPKALYIVPWKSSEIGVEISMDMALTERAVPVDREVFKRQLEFFEVSTAGTGRDGP